MIKPIAALIAAATFAMPASAKVDPGSIHLLQTLDTYGVTVLYNPSTCSKGFAGAYSTDKVMTLCYTGAPTGGDHDTIRHEAFHFIQHCAAKRRNLPGIVPLAINPELRNRWVQQVLKDGTIDHVLETYPDRAHQIELEAFAAAHHYTAAELSTLITKWCIT